MSEHHNQGLVQCFRKDITYAALSGQAYKLGTVPRSAVVTGVTVGVKTAFDAVPNVTDPVTPASAANVLIVGTLSDDDALVASSGVDITTAGVTRVSPATLAGNVAASADTDIYYTYTQVDVLTAATHGAAWIEVEFVLSPTKYV